MKGHAVEEVGFLEDCDRSGFRSVITGWLDCLTVSEGACLPVVGALRKCSHKFKESCYDT